MSPAVTPPGPPPPLRCLRIGAFGGEVLARGAEELAHLARLVVRGNCLTSAGVARLAGLGPTVDADENDPEYRYVSVSE